MSRPLKEACPECPFRADTQMHYDEEALESLDAGRLPSCHMVVGYYGIFDDPAPPEGERCEGHEKWAADVPGYVRPEPKASFG